jgi:hypothetical protein
MQQKENEEIQCGNLCVKYFVDQEIIPDFRNNIVSNRKAAAEPTGLDMSGIWAKLFPKNLCKL